MPLAAGTVLVVDDDPDIRDILRDSLDALGHRTLTASGGERCLEIVERATPMVVLLDIALPDGDGLDVLRRIRQWSGDPTVVMIRPEPREAGAVDVLQPDVGRAGITETRKIAVLAETYHRPLALYCGMGLGPYVAASLQVGAAIPNLRWIEFQPEMHAASDAILAEPLRVVDGHLVVPSATARSRRSPSTTRTSPTQPFLS